MAAQTKGKKRPTTFAEIANVKPHSNGCVFCGKPPAGFLEVRIRVSGGKRNIPASESFKACEECGAGKFHDLTQQLTDEAQFAPSDE